MSHLNKQFHIAENSFPFISLVTEYQDRITDLASWLINSNIFNICPFREKSFLLVSPKCSSISFKKLTSELLLKMIAATQCVSILRRVQSLWDKYETDSIGTADSFSIFDMSQENSFRLEELHKVCIFVFLSSNLRHRVGNEELWKPYWCFY